MEKSSLWPFDGAWSAACWFHVYRLDKYCAHCRDADETPVSVGYDKIEFLKPVFLGGIR